MSAAEAPEFLDTNVLVYAHDVSAAEKRERARRLFGVLWRERRGALSVQVLQEFFVTSTTKIPNPLPVADSARIVEMLSAWTVHVPRPADVLRAIDIQQAVGISFWDAMIVRSAARLGCGVLWTEDLSEGQVYEGVFVRNPFS